MAGHTDDPDFDASWSSGQVSINGIELPGRIRVRFKGRSSLDNFFSGDGPIVRCKNAFDGVVAIEGHKPSFKLRFYTSR